MARKTIREIARLLSVARVATPGLNPEFSLYADDGNKSLKFSGEVKIGNDIYSVAADNGKVKKFTNADDYVKVVAQHLETSDGTYTVAISTGLVLVSALPADLKKDAASKVLKFNAKKTAQTAVKADLDAQIVLMDGWDQGNALQVVRLQEVTAERSAVVEDIAAIDALIAKYTAIAAG